MSITSNINLSNQQEKFKFDIHSNTPNDGYNTQKNLNSIFNKAEQFNLSSILLQTESPALHEHISKTPENFNQQRVEKTNTNFNKNNINEMDILNQPTNKFLFYYNKLKYEELAIKDTIVYASSLFDLKEYLKCTFVLKPIAIPRFPTAMFLYFYSEYMIIQQKKHEDMLENSDMGSKYYSTKEVVKLQQILQGYESKGELSPFMLFLYGLLLKEVGMNHEAKEVLVKALNQFPFLWSTWVELALISKQNEIVL
jgi:hypothetical protein